MNSKRMDDLERAIKREVKTKPSLTISEVVERMCLGFNIGVRNEMRRRFGL